MRLKTIILSLLLITVYSVNAQRWSQRKYELQYGIGVSNFMGDISAPVDASKLVWINLPYTLAPIANVGLKYNFKGSHYVGANMHFGQMRAFEISGRTNYFTRGLRFNSFFTELSVRYELLILKEKKQRTIYKQLGESRLKNFNMPTYLFVGFGSIINYGSLVKSQEAPLNVLRDNIFNVAPVVPIGVGVKFRATRYTSINIEAGLRIALNDGIDGADGKDNSSYGEWIDQYQFLTVNLAHKLKSNRKGLPKFRK